MKSLVFGTVFCASMSMGFRVESQTSTQNAVVLANPQQCIEQKCPTQWAACQKDPKCIPALQDCQKKCGTKQSCWELCLPGKGSQAAIDVAKCAQANNCLKSEPSTALMVADPQQCIEQKCPTQWAACQKDPKCIPTLQDCQRKCGTTQSCWKTCLATKGSQAAINVAKCAQANNCLSSEPSTALMVADPQQCIEQKCPTQWAACQKDPKCIPALQDCQKKCGTKQSCWELCLPGKGSQAAIDVAKCAQANNCLKSEPSTALMVADPQQCIEQKCPTQWAACQKDPKCIPTLQDCQRKCGTTQSCWKTCLATKGSQAAINVAKCAQANNCLSSEPSTALMVADPQQCIEQKCPTQWAACQKDPKCIPALQDCQKKCGTKQSCWELCLPGKGSQAAIDVAKCAQANNCLKSEPSTALMVADPQQCIEQKCPTQWAACQKDPKCIPTLQDCQRKCGTTQSCWKTCLATKGSQAAINVAKCAQANNCLSSEPSTALMVADPQQCIEQKCPTQWAACQKDPKCIPALQDCQKKCGTKQSCWELCLPGKGSQAAIDVAKCAQANNCLKSEPFAHSFQTCMSKTCSLAFSECLNDQNCRSDLRVCRDPANVWNFYFECLVLKSQLNPKVEKFFKCAGESKCI